MSDKRLTNGSLALNNKKVITIDAVKMIEEAKLRVAAYARVSSDSTDQLNSFVAQTNHYISLISSNENWTLVDIYADEGITGTSADKRNEFQRLLSDCRKGLIDRVLVKSISRFARNTKECLEYVRELRSIGVTVYFEEQRIDTGKMNTEFMAALHASIAQTESESISGNMRWSYKHRMEKGLFITCKAPLGYRLIDGQLVIHEPEAEIVQLIFNNYLAGYSREEIAAQVTALGIPTRDGKEVWRASAITYILCNEKYAGDVRVQKKYTTETLPFKKKLNHGERDQYFMPERVPAIIDREVFDAVAELMEKRKCKISTAPREASVFTQKIICGECGSLFKQTSCRGTVNWVCRTHRKDKNSCSIMQIPEERIHAAFLRLYYKLKVHGETVLGQLLSDLKSVKDKKMLWSEDVIALNKKISELSDQNRMLAEMKKLGLVDSDIFIAKTNDLARQLAEAKQKKARIAGEAKDEAIPKTRELLECLEDMPEFLLTFDPEIFEALVERITVESNTRLKFHLKNGMEIREII